MPKEKLNIDKMSQVETFLLLGSNDLLNRVRKKIVYGVFNIEREFTNQHYNAVEWRRRQFKLAQEVITMVEEACRKDEP